MTNLLTAEAALGERHAVYARRKRLLRQATASSEAIAADWPSFWEQVNGILANCGYAHSTRLQFRQVLRGLRRAGVQRPADISPSVVQRLMYGLAQSGASWSWIALHTNVLRTVFDRLCGKSVTAGIVTPKRGQRLPETLSAREAEQLVQAGQTIRDQLLLGLLYGCGLAGSEAVNLRWRDVLNSGKRLHIARSTRYMERVLTVPEPLHALLRAGIATCEPDDYIFRGRSEGSHLSTRMVEIMVRRAREDAGIACPVCVMTLRHSYAVCRLASGASLPQLQEELGHASIRTTERYRRCLAPKLESHPFSKVRRLMNSYVGADPSLPTVAHPGQAARSGSFQPSTMTHQPFSRPLASMKAVDIGSLALPFPRDKAPSPAAAFRRLLKTPLLSGILRRRRPRSP